MAIEAARAYEGAEAPPDSTPWREAPFVVVDLETTGFDPGQDEIISFATVPVEGGRARPGAGLYELVRPERMPAAATIRIHGLRPADLAAARPLADLTGALLDALAGRVLVAHVAAIEERFLRAALGPHGVELRNPVADTAAMAARLALLRGHQRAARRTIGLSPLARSLGLPVHRPHHADGDALTTAQAFIALASHLEAYEPVSVGSLRSLPAPRGGPKRLQRLARRAASALRRQP
jgi:DNA polymerase-3 subunit epsilon